MNNTEQTRQTPARLLTTTEVAKRLSVAPRTVRVMCDRGELRHVRIGAGVAERATYRIHPDSLERLLSGGGDDA